MTEYILDCRRRRRRIEEGSSHRHRQLKAETIHFPTHPVALDQVCRKKIRPAGRRLRPGPGPGWDTCQPEEPEACSTTRGFYSIGPSRGTVTASVS
jgi:hypothetical protein